MSTTRRGAVDAPPRGQGADIVITLGLLLVFVAAYLAAQDWPFKARLFPGLITIAGIVLCVVKLVAVGVEVLRRRQDTPAPVTDRDDEAADEDEDDESLEYVFAKASLREWAIALAWITAFFTALYVLGVFITVPAFAFTYLRFAGRVGWLAAALYAAVAGSVIWLAFDYLLFVPMPAGIF